MDTVGNIDDSSKVKNKASKEQLTFEKMRVAMEKLQQARIKTTITLIALGFGAYKFFFARVEDGKKPLLDFPNGRDIGMILILAGFLTLLLATLQHMKSLANLRQRYTGMPYSISLWLSFFVLALALFLFLAVALYR